MVFDTMALAGASAMIRGETTFDKRLVPLIVQFSPLMKRSLTSRNKGTKYVLTLGFFGPHHKLLNKTCRDLSLKSSSLVVQNMEQISNLEDLNGRIPSVATAMETLSSEKRNIRISGILYMSPV